MLGSGFDPEITEQVEAFAPEFVLVSAGFDTGAPALLIWEGVTPYLTEDAIRATCYAGTLVSTAYYHGSQGLKLAGEWHRNRIQVISSRACSEPLSQASWSFARIRAESLALLVEGRLQADDLIDPLVPFSQAADAYHEIDVHPERSIKLGIDHTLDQRSGLA